MRRWVLGGLIFAFILLAGTFSWLYFSVGLKEYLQVIRKINQLPKDQKTQSWDDFFALGEPSLYGGTLAGFWKGKIWIWGRSGLRSFQPDEYTVYSFFSACTPEILYGTQDKEQFSIDRSVESDIGSWKTKIKPGDYVTAAIATQENGGVLGNLREMYGYDWRVFMPSNLKQQCTKR